MGKGELLGVSFVEEDNVVAVEPASSSMAAIA
jgi:hypothetical protein